MNEEELQKMTKKQLIGLCLNLIYERDSQIKEKEFIQTRIR